MLTAKKPSPMPKRKSRQRYNFSNTRFPVRGGCTPDCKRNPYPVRGGCTPDCKRSPYLVRGGCTPRLQAQLAKHQYKRLSSYRGCNPLVQFYRIISSSYRRIAGATRSYNSIGKYQAAIAVSRVQPASTASAHNLTNLWTLCLQSLR